MSKNSGKNGRFSPKTYCYCKIRNKILKKKIYFPFYSAFETCL